MNNKNGGCMKKFVVYLLVILFFIVGLNAYAQVIGTVTVQGSDGLLNLPVVTELDAINAGHGVVKIALDGGVVGAAQLGLTSDPDASPVRV